MKKILLIFLLHFIIMVAYVALAFFIFVSEKDADPVGNGMLQLVLTVSHLAITLVITTMMVIRTKEKQKAARNLAIHLSAVIFWAIIGYAADDSLSEFAWSLR
jgi:dipeptide/tripeptide permease